MTPMMEITDIVQAFNASGERDYWKATVAGTKALPCASFNSRASMVQIFYFPLLGRFKVKFNRTSCAFGDFMASVHRSLAQVLTALKATGMDIASPLDLYSGTLRIEYDPKTKECDVYLANLGDDWQSAQPLDFKVEEQVENTEENIA